MNNTTKNILKLKRKFLCPYKGMVSTNNENLVRAINLDIGSFGYTLSNELMKRLIYLPEDYLKEVYQFFMETLSEMVGDNVSHKPLFVNFPEEVPDELDYYIRRVTGYLENYFGIENGKLLSCGHYINEDKFDLKGFGACPICQRQVDENIGQGNKRIPLTEITPLKIIDFVSINYGLELFENICNKKSMSSSDKEYVENFVKDYPILIYTEIVRNIKSRENKMFLLNILYKNKINNIILKEYFKSSTDVLRFINALNDGDVSLKDKCIYKSMPRKLRKELLSILCDFRKIEDFWNYKNKWIKVGEVLHPGEYIEKYYNAWVLFNFIRNEKYSKLSFNYKLDTAIKERNYIKMVELLKDKPSLFTRHLDFMLRYGISETFIVRCFNIIIDKVEINILLTLWKYFQTRDQKKDFRYFFPKGNVNKVKVIEDTRLSIPNINNIINIIQDEIIKRFSEKRSFGKVYIDPLLKNIILPFNSRGDSDSLNPMTKGSRIDMDNKETIRMFCHWKGNCDVDLSVGFYDKDWKFLSYVSYSRLISDGVTHSGDIQNAPKGASEFIDIDRKYIDTNVKYAVMTCIVYNGNTFDNINETFAGVMMRDEANKGQIFEPKTVEHKFDIEANTKMIIPLIFDLKENQIIWTDIALKSNDLYNTIERANENISMIGKSMSRLIKDKVTIKELIDFNMQTEKSYYVNNKEEADTVIGVNEGDYSLLDIEKLLKDFL